MKALPWVLGGGAAAIGAGLYFANGQRTTPRSGTVLMLPGAKKDFVATMRDAVGGQVGTSPGLALIIAHAAYETNWGHTSGWTKGNNAFNITAGSTWKGDTVPGPDTEFNAAGVEKPITQSWRSYPTPRESVADYIAFIQQKRFGVAWTKLRAGDSTFTDALYAAKYFTEPPDKYRAGVESALAYVQVILDQPAAPPKPKPTPMEQAVDDAAAQALTAAGVADQTPAPSNFVEVPGDGTSVASPGTGIPGVDDTGDGNG